MEAFKPLQALGRFFRRGDSVEDPKVVEARREVERRFYEFAQLNGDREVGITPDFGSNNVIRREYGEVRRADVSRPIRPPYLDYRGNLRFKLVK